MRGLQGKARILLIGRVCAFLFFAAVKTAAMGFIDF